MRRVEPFGEPGAEREEVAGGVAAAGLCLEPGEGQGERQLEASCLMASRVGQTLAEGGSWARSSLVAVPKLSGY